MTNKLYLEDNKAFNLHPFKLVKESSSLQIFSKFNELSFFEMSELNTHENDYDSSEEGIIKK